MSHELYKKYRPKSLKGVVGQPEAVRVLSEFVKNDRIPHAILFSGPSGCGKTTLARILKKHLECEEADFTEMNCADFRGVDMVRDLRQRIHFAPMGGKSRIWLIDECHQLTKDAQQAFLKMLEDTPSHVYFLLATTEPGKLLKTIQTRCTEVRVQPMSQQSLKELTSKVAEEEKFSLPEEVQERLVELCEGSARKALVLLDQILTLDDEEEMLNCLLKSEVKRQAIELARALINPTAKWSDVAAILKTVEEDPESLRHLVLAYASNVCLGGGKLASRAALILSAFRDNFYDSKRAGLVLACWEVLGGK